MARPQRVYPKQLPQFNKLHTRLVKMMSGVHMTALHIIKETARFYISIDSWAFCCGQFKGSKATTKLKVELPTLTDKATLSFLEKECWADWVDKQVKCKDTDTLESLEFLNRIFPDKKKVYFYELKSLLAAYCHGNFIRYKEDGSVEPQSEHNIKQTDYYNFKYVGFGASEMPADVKKLYDAYHKVERKGEAGEKAKTAAYKEYRAAHDKHIRENYNLRDIFIKIGEHSVVCPYAFTNCCVAGSSYENAGEIYMVITEDTVYFETERHF